MAIRTRGRAAWLGVVALALTLAVHGAAPAAPDAPSPSWAELEAAGAVIGEIRIVNENVFDTSNPKEDYLLFRWANALHIRTRPGVIRRALLFKPGDKVSARTFEETERNLRSDSYLYDVQFRPLAVHDGTVDVEVVTRDTWSLDLGISASRSGGASASRFEITERNLLGTGSTVGFGRTRDVDRSGNVFLFANERAFGTLASVRLSHASNSDGRSDAVSVVRPFYSLDARWSAGVSVSRFDRIDSIYNAGVAASQYRHRQRLGEAFGGWSAGLIDGWVQRYSLGVSVSDDAYATQPAVVAPARLPADRKLVGPFVRYELIEDRFDRQLNRNLIGRPEFFALGLAATVQLGWASTALGSSDDALLYKASIGRGFETGGEQTLTTAASLSGQLAHGRVQRQQAGAVLQYYRPQSPRWLLYAAAAGDLLTHPDVGDSLMLGGDNGLRGYPLRYQSGTRRALFTAEERFYTDIHLWQLFRIGGAAFFDAGRAWGGDNANAANPGWLSDAGFGLRIASTRTATGGVLHIDVAFPLTARADISKAQFLVRTKTSF
ncbi:MAG: Outer membrane protein assembly factor BamA [Burkholderiaceae bacterium]|nr:Outer membrane protein assembly factor BamA [Burkholderiaceae bacterium]